MSYTVVINLLVSVVEEEILLVMVAHGALDDDEYNNCAFSCLVVETYGDGHR